MRSDGLDTQAANSFEYVDNYLFWKSVKVECKAHGYTTFAKGSRFAQSGQLLEKPVWKESFLHFEWFPGLDPCGRAVTINRSYTWWDCSRKSSVIYITCQKVRELSIYITVDKAYYAQESRRYGHGQQPWLSQPGELRGNPQVDPRTHLPVYSCAIPCCLTRS